MGKKIKKDEKGPPDDEFEAMQVESRQAATAVLMLSSPEEDVLSKACQSIYKFVEKCDENKKLLLELNAVDDLLRLIQHEDRIVRRNATMALGIMAGQVDVRRYLRKREEVFQRVLVLLSPEEDAVVHEFAVLVLLSLAHNYTAKVAIIKQDGLGPLVNCLSSSDPDVQKNSVETIALMLEDYEAKVALRSVEGLAPLLELIKSEYPVIQHLALVALERAAQDVDNRAALRELQGVDALINFIGRPEWNDLHVFAVMVLSNCLEDPETMQALKESRGIARLVAFITDTQPPEEEEKKGKKGDKGASRAGKKGKGDDGGKGKDDKSKTRGETEAIIATLPEVKEHAARAISRAAKNSENRRLLHELEVEKMLIQLLDHEDPAVRVAGARGLAVMATNLSSREAIVQWEALEPLVKMIKHDNSDMKEAASLALSNLTTANMTNCSEFARLHGIEPTILLLSDSRELAVASAAVILTNMSSDEALRAQIQSAGVVEALIQPLQSQNTVVQCKVALAVAAFMSDQVSRSQFLEGGGLGHLVQLLHSNDDDVRRNSSWAVTVCAADYVCAEEICRLGGLAILQQIQQSTSCSNAFTDAAVDKLLDSNLIAKYALTGSLGPHDVITDGFLDIGQLRGGSQMLSLEQYLGQLPNHRRPILLINAKPEKPSTPQPSSEAETTEKASKSSMAGGRGSRTGRDSKGKSRAQREREEKQKEEEQQAQQQEEEPVSGDVVPADPALLQYIEEVVERVAPLPSTTHQVVALAQFVAEKMGGPIDRGQVANFSWELPLSQLRFDLNSNVIPIGMIKSGIHYHRALLFKALADRIAVHCWLVRGEYNRAWNEVLLSDETDTMEPPKFPPSRFLVDLVHQPGRLLPVDCPDAISYQRL